jgi:3-oxoacyl-[acyl-carrier protein] reductase
LGIGPVKRFSGRHALVIGGSGGIGRAVAVGLAKRGAGIMIHGGSSQERLDTTIKTLDAAGAEYAGGFLYPLDTDASAEQLLAHTQAPDILICAWGPFKRGTIETMTNDDWQYMVWANFTFPGAVVSAVLPHMLQQRWGRILLFGGTNTDHIRGFTTTAVYSSAKTALNVLAKSVAQSAGRAGITCNVICPGLTDTEYTDAAARHYNHSHTTDPLMPDDIAHAALMVLDSPHINGAVIPVDRGLVLYPQN